MLVKSEVEAKKLARILRVDHIISSDVTHRSSSEREIHFQYLYSLKALTSTEGRRKERRENVTGAKLECVVKGKRVIVHLSPRIACHEASALKMLKISKLHCYFKTQLPIVREKKVGLIWKKEI